MIYNRKIINMDYRNGSATTFGFHSEPFWPRDDETITHDQYRLDKRVHYVGVRSKIEGACLDDNYDRENERVKTRRRQK